MNLDDLAKHDGRNGNKAYVAINGKVYDVSTSDWWTDGDHQGAHQAGADLTQELAGAPHVRAVIERFPVVDHIAEPDPPKKKGLFGFLKK
ncbi:Predicted heme/steroid binding protein [Geoalkalibacter ferrihydriticus]|uniref:Predicted heme/steroid binding protein n=1 Tax=Geoalkalibacter ferrihydriticus TaxID=392333 RepID=A0A1G9T1P6_9BACT|nr:cytochrome b5 domain-containing protein [Geoalkalibacter ferrihydriticus]SDM41654.1 Predicted heme/steroid binding protein [Geoalkalibacter ferrihydriticus]